MARHRYLSPAGANDGLRSRQRRRGHRRGRGLKPLLLALALSLGAVGQAYAQEMPVAGSMPTYIDIPAIDAHAPVVALGEEEDGTMQAPIDPDTVGWYSLGTGIGAPGNALLDGHVDWAGRLRVFGFLRQLGPGDTIQLTDASGNLLNYQVMWTRLYDADSAPLDEIFAPTDDEEEVTLITCGGAFDASISMYVSRWVVRAVRAPDPETSASAN